MRKKRKSITCIFAAVCIIISIFILLTLYSVEVSYFFGVRIRSHELMELRHSCEEIHISMVIGGANAAYLATTLLKSILMQTQNPIKLHLIVDHESDHILSKLMETWILPGVTYHLYDVDSHMNGIDWIPNKHYSGKYGLVKLLLTDILPTTVEQVILLDIDILLLTDIHHLWEVFSKMTINQYLAMTENLSEWYVTRTPTKKTWPALGRGFNSGITLMRLGEMRRTGWKRIWSTEAMEHLRFASATSLADQDILNAVVSSHSSIIYKLPCSFNYQLGLRSDRTLCPIPTENIKILHWNSPNKTIVSEFDAVRSNFENMDGDSIQFARIQCQQRKPIMKSQILDECQEFMRAASVPYRTHLNLLGAVSKTEDEMTLVSQFSSDRLTMFHSLALSWKGPMSVSVYGDDQEIHDVVRFSREIFSPRSNIKLHAVYKKNSLFPINYLRNVALKEVSNEFVFIADIDFVINGDLQPFNLPSRSVFVVPAFENHESNYSHSTGQLTKHQFYSKWISNEVGIFRGKIWPQGHAPTRYDSWWNSTEPYKVDWQTNYEPYIIGRVSEINNFDNRFVGFGWNKVSHSMLMHKQGFNFLVHPSLFMIHLPHSPSVEITKYRSSFTYRRCMKRLKKEFIADMYKHKFP